MPPLLAGHSPSKVFVIIVVLGSLAVLALLLLLVLGFYSYYQFSGRIVPGVHVGATDLGGMTITEAAIELQKSWNLDNTIQVTNGIKSVGILPAELGLGIEPLHTARRAYEIAHDDIIPAEMMQMLQNYHAELATGISDYDDDVIEPMPFIVF